jgi:hypothetical protein
MTADRDPQVGAALDVLEPVPPRPGFWAEVEARLRAEPPAPALQLARLPGAGPSPRTIRRRRTVAGVLAAAAVLAVALVAGSLRDGREPHETVPATTPDGGASSTPATGPDAAIGALDPAVVALDAWSHAVDHSDAAAGWDLLGPQSREMLGDQAALHELMTSGTLKETWGGVDVGSGRQQASVQCVPGDDAGTCLVVAYPPDRPDAPVAAAVVLRPTSTLSGEGAASVEAFLPGNDLGLIAVPKTVGDDHVPASQPVPLHIEAQDAGQVLVYLAGGGASGAAPDRDLVRDASGTITGVRFSADLWPSGPQPGTYFVAVLVRTDEGGSLALEQQQVQITGLG